MPAGVLVLESSLSFFSLRPGGKLCRLWGCDKVTHDEAVNNTGMLQ